MINRTTTLGIGSAAAAALAVGVSLYSSAQAQQPPLAGPRNFVPNQEAPFPQRGFATQPGDAAAMVNDPADLYVLRGNVVFRVSKQEMRVTGRVELPMRPNIAPARGQSTERPARAGGAPPPPAK